MHRGAISFIDSRSLKGSALDEIGKGIKQEEGGMGADLFFVDILFDSADPTTAINALHIYTPFHSLTMMCDRSFWC